MEKTYIVDDQEAGVFRVNRRAYTDPNKRGFPFTVIVMTTIQASATAPASK